MQTPMLRLGLYSSMIAALLGPLPQAAAQARDTNEEARLIVALAAEAVPGERGHLLAQLAKLHHDQAALDTARALTRRAELAFLASRDETNRNAMRIQRAVLEREIGRPIVARDVLDSVLPELVRSDDSIGLGEAHNLLGWLHNDRREGAAAIAQFREGLVRLGDADSSLASDLRAGLGVASRWANRPDEALRTYTELGAYYAARQDRLGMARNLHNIGLVQLDQHRVEAARHSLRSARDSLFSGGDPPLNTWEVLKDLGIAHLRGSEPEPLVAQRYFDSAATVLSHATRAAGGDAARRDFLERSDRRGLFDGWIESWVGPPGPGAIRGRLAAAALTAWEHGRAQALLAQLRERASGEQSMSAGSPYRPPRGSAALVLGFVNGRLARWLITAEGSTELTWSAASADTIRTHAEYLLDKVRSGTPGDTMAVLLAASGMSRGLGASDAPPIDSLLRRLSQWLLPPSLINELPRLRELIVVPQGILAAVPIAALPVHGAALVTRVAIRHAPSLAVLGAVEARPRVTGGALVVGDPLMPSLSMLEGPATRLPQLPGARREAAGIADLLGVELLTGAGATEDTIRRLLPAAAIVHFATHGLAYAEPTRAGQSFLAFASTVRHDGLLRMDEVLEVGFGVLRLELIVLSACQSGLGLVQESEGTVGLQRAFLALGARSLLVSLWNVDDDATAELMLRFHRYWRGGAGADKAQALRRAQLEVLALGGRNADPIRWAAFQLVGAR